MMQHNTMNQNAVDQDDIMNSTIKTLLEHRSVRQFTDEPIKPEVLTTLLEAGRAVSTSNFSQAVSVVRITEPSLREQFFQISNNIDEDAYQKALGSGKKFGHTYVKSAPEFLVFCMDTHRHNQVVPEAHSDWMEVTLIAAVDVALFAQNVLTAAESLGLGGVYIGSMRNDITRASKLIKAPKHVVPLFGMCLGHPTPEAKQVGLKPRLPLSVLLSENQYCPASDEALQEYNDTVRAYYEQRGDKVSDWTQHMVKTYGEPLRPDVMDYLNQQGFAKR